jgi:Na+/proline symporter
MTSIDWILVVLFMASVMGVGLWFARRASKSMDEYFVAGRTIPWWLAGTSMLATSFASDTPLHTTRAIREDGLGAGWFYWNGIIGGLIIAFVFSRLWRRAGVVTDNELMELRYTGKRAAVLRGGLALFKTLFLEILTMAWITLGMTKIVRSIVDLPETFPLLGFDVQAELVVVAGLILFTIAYSVASGFWGVVSTDIGEFAVAMLGAIVLAVVAMQKVGGVSGLREGLSAMGRSDALDLVPSGGFGGIGMLAFGVYLGVQWWASPGVDGSGQRAQRFLACKDEGHAIAAGIWNMAVQWLIRSWPWYVTALASLVLYPTLADHEAAYPKMVADLLPVGLKGLMVASFFAAFMGTMEAHYNLTASYAMNDVYKRFLVKERSEAHYVRASRWMTLAVAVIAGGTALLLPSVLGAFRFKIELVAGLGLVYLLRWFWWRVNATSELTALVTSVIAALTFNTWSVTAGGGSNGSALRLLLVTGVSAVSALVATFLTKPEPTEHLIRFYLKVRPPRRFWRPIAEAAGSTEASDLGWSTLAQVGLAMAFVFCGMIGLGKLILGEPVLGACLLAAAAVTGTWSIRWVFGARSRTEAEAAPAPGVFPRGA